MNNNIDENNQKDPKKRSIIIIEDLIDEKNQIKKENKLKKNKTKNIIKQISIILNKPRNILFSIVLYILSIISILIAVGLYNIREINHNYILLCFEFKPIPQNYYTKEFFVFLTSVYATYLILLIILVFILIISYALIKNNNNFYLYFFEDSSIFFPIYLLCFMLKSILGMIFLMDLFLLYFDLILTIVAFLSLGYFFVKGKNRKYKNIFNLLSQYFFPSVLFCFELYTLIFLICRILTIDLCESHNRQYKIKVELIANIIYFFSGVSIMFFYKDIIYPLTLVIIETGLLTKAGSSEFYLVILNIFFLCFLFYSSLFIIITKKSQFFELEIKDSNIKQVRLI
jgi:hypothetical protein